VKADGEQGLESRRVEEAAPRQVNDHPAGSALGHGEQLLLERRSRREVDLSEDGHDRRPAFELLGRCSEVRARLCHPDLLLGSRPPAEVWGRHAFSTEL
jgi:hypothetical protein